MRSGIARMASGRRNAAKPNLAPIRAKRRLASRFFAVSALSNDAKGWNLSPTVLVLQDGFDAALSTDDPHLEGNPRLARRYHIIRLYRKTNSIHKPKCIAQVPGEKAGSGSCGSEDQL